MNTFLVKPSYQSFELPIEAKGRQYIGYLDMSSLEQSPCGQFASFCLIDASNQILRFTINQKIWQQIQQQIKTLRFDKHQHLYIWIEIDTQTAVVNSRVFQINWQIEQLMTVFQSCYHFEVLYQLFTLISKLSTPALMKFCHDLMDNLHLMKRWVSLPASKQHHHSYPGGLLAHSLECAMITQQNTAMLTQLSIREKEITVLAALLHDIGETQTLKMHGHTATGRLLDHDLLTLQLLAKPLELLTKTWPDGAQTLQYLLTWKPNMGFCRYIGGNIIKLADQISTSASLNRMAFANSPDYYQFAKLTKTTYSLNMNRLC